MNSEWPRLTVATLQAAGILLVEDGNHGEYRPRSDEFGDYGVSFVRAADMSDGRVLFKSASRINEVARRRIRKGIGRPGDVLLSHKGTVGKVAFVQSNCPEFVCSPQTTFWRVLDETALDRNYLFAYMQSLEFKNQLGSRKGETDMADYVSLTAQRQLSVPLPPIEVQRSISERLTVLNDRLTLIRDTNTTLEAIAQVLFKSWFIDFDPVRAKMEGRVPEGMDEATAALFPSDFDESAMGLVPTGWVHCSLKEVTSIFDSKRIPLSGAERAKRRGPYPYYGAAALMDHVDAYLFDGVYLLTGEDGSVATEAGYPITQYVWGKFWVNNHAHVLQGKAGVSTEHLMLALKQTNIHPYITGAVQAKLSQANMWRIKFLCPSREISERFGEVLAPLYATCRHNMEQAQTLATLRDALLSRLISGQLRLPEITEALEEELCASSL